MAKRRPKGHGSISQRDDGTWRGYLTLAGPNGQPKRHYRYGRTKKAVADKLEQLKRQFDAGVDPTPRSLATYLRQWLAYKKAMVRPSTLASYEGYVRNHIVPSLGHLHLDKLKPLQVQQLIHAVAKRSGERSANGCRSILFMALKQAVRWQLVPRNVVEAVDPVPLTNTRKIKPWSAQEAIRFLKFAEQHRLYAAFYLVIATGLRRGELLALRWDDLTDTGINVQRQLVSIKGQLHFAPPKSRTSIRHIPLGADVLDALDAHRQRQQHEAARAGPAWASTGLIFTNELGGPLDPNNLSRTWRKLRQAAQVPPIRFHDLRHLHASLLFDQGFDLKLVSERLGHTRASFTMDTYVHLINEQRQRQAIGLRELLPGLGGGAEAN